MRAFHATDSAMTPLELPFRATTLEACAWLEQQTGSPWRLARLLEHGLTPYVWLDYDPAFAELFGDANGGYAAPIFFRDDIARLAAGSEDVLITRTKDAYKIVARLPEPGFRRPLDALRFQQKDLKQLAAALARGVQPGAADTPPAPKPASESRLGIPKEQVLAAFAAHARMDLDKALDGAIGIFGDDGARVKASARKSKRNAVWNPVTLALGLNDVYRVPLGPLKRAFKTHDFLLDWEHDWDQSLRLLGK
jgi:hypothetical protein